MFSNNKINEWYDLQVAVNDFLTECGFTTEIEKQLKTTRDVTEIDVYAEEFIEGRKYTILCECKYWKSAIPKTIVHAFRTVVADSGSNAGFIITISKFQKGAYEAADLTNIELLDWNEFQEKFKKSWYINYFVPQLSKITSPEEIEDYRWVDWFDDLTPEDKHIYGDIKNRLSEVDDVTSHFPYSPFKHTEFEIHELPLRKHGFYENSFYEIPSEILDEDNYSELLVKIENYIKPYINRFILLDKKYRD